jgi:hypothetical protein
VNERRRWYPRPAIDKGANESATIVSIVVKLVEFVRGVVNRGEGIIAERRCRRAESGYAFARFPCV